jgi:delta(3,5)-delta(2,4)-dienoyl-CoA isomerase
MFVYKCCFENSAVIGGGVDLLCAADIRVCSQDAFFCIKETDVGLAADVGTLQRIQHVIGNSSLARELAYTSRRMYADEAKSAGFVSSVHPDRNSAIKAALDMATVISSKSPLAVTGTKVHIPLPFLCFVLIYCF